MTMGNLYLLIFFNNLPFPFSSPALYVILWLAGLFFHYQKMFLSKGLLYIYLFIIIYLIGISFFWQDRIVGTGILISYRWLFMREVLPVFLAILIYTYFIKIGDFVGIAWVVLCVLIFITITAITSIIGLNIYPMASRDLAGGLSVRGATRLIEFYNKIGIASFGFFSGLAFAFPVLLYYFRKNWRNRTLKYIFIGMLVLFLFSIIRSGFAATFLFVALFSAAAFVARKNLKRSLVLVFIVGIILSFTPAKYFANILYTASSYFTDTPLEERLYDAGATIEHPDIDLESSEHAGKRLGRIPFLLDSFAENIIIGGGEDLGHNFWFDRLSMFGLLGLFPWFLLIRYQIISNLKLFVDDFKSYYILSMVAFITYGLLKNMGGMEMMVFVFFLIPGIYYLKYLKYFPSLENK